MCPFNSSSFPDSLALAKETGLSIGNMDEIQKLHIRTVPLGEQPRRLAHQDTSRTFAVALSQCLNPTGRMSAPCLCIRISPKAMSVLPSCMSLPFATLLHVVIDLLYHQNGTVRPHHHSSMQRQGQIRQQQQHCIKGPLTWQTGRAAADQHKAVLICSKHRYCCNTDNLQHGSRPPFTTPTLCPTPPSSSHHTMQLCI